jgi:para-nitrobenzyl esterase
MPAPWVTTQSGNVAGTTRDGVTVFLGLPYAAAPVGELTFAAPQPHPPWDGVRDCSVEGPTAPYRLRNFPALDLTPLLGAGWRRGDDYLALNIWTPDVGARGLPVMVFIHGGAHVAGCGSAPANDGAAFARSGVVCVTLNYRLGVNGFMPIPGAPTNLGLRDQIAALAWVKANIAAFGGDPENVTAFGESAGAMALGCLLASPLSKGLFRRAILQSGHGSMVRPLAAGQRLARKFARMLGVAPTVEGFRSRTVEQWLGVLERIQLPTTRLDLRDDKGRDPGYGLGRFLPVHGDDVLPEPPLDALANGTGAEVELLIGTTAEETNLYFVPTGVTKKVNRLMAWLVLRRSTRRAGAILKAYGLGRRGRRAGEVFGRVMDDLIFRLPARAFAAAHQGRTHVYEFDWRSPAWGGELGACHGLEVPFVFNTLASCTGPTGIAGESPPQALADRVHGLWAGFATSGALPWPQYDAQTRQVYLLEHGETVTEPPIAAERFVH